MPGGARDGLGDTQGVERDLEGAKQRQWALTEVIQDFLEDVGEGWSLLHEGVM